MVDSLETDQLYWDQRTRKALYPTRVTDDTVEFTTIWHTEEVTDALAGEALVPIEDVGLDRTETTFDLLDSFRLPNSTEESLTVSGNETEHDEQ